MTKFRLNFTLAFLPTVFLAASLQASPPSPGASFLAEQPSATAATHSPSPAAAPSPPQGRITAYTLPPDLYRKARNRGRIGFASRMIGFFYGLVVLWVVLRRKLSASYRDWAESFSRQRFLQAFIFTALLVLTIGVLHLPVDTFDEAVSKLYKISVEPWSSWAADWAKAQLLAIIIGSLLVWILYAVMRKSPRRWWLYFWIISLPLLLFGMFISPYVIDPLFNKYEPLYTKAPQLVPELQRVARRAGQEIPPERMFWMKASDKTIATNASVNGFGASKRIIIWDTTLAQETTDEVLTDFGHEMGHYVLGHIPKLLSFVAALLLLFFFLGYSSIGWVLSRWGQKWGIRAVDDWASLPALLLLLSILFFLANPLFNAVSRHEEHQADQYGLEVTHGLTPDSAQVAAQAFQVLGDVDLADPDPDEIDIFLFYNHPAIRDRVQFSLTYDPWSKNQQPEFVK